WQVAELAAGYRYTTENSTEKYLTARHCLGCSPCNHSFKNWFIILYLYYYTLFRDCVMASQRRSGLCGMSIRLHREMVMIRRIFATSLVCLCLLTAPVLPAFGQNGQGQNGNHQGQNGNHQGQNGQGSIRVPEPSATLLLALALGGVGALEWRRRSRAK